MTLTSDISSCGVPGGAVTTAENWEREYEALIGELVGALKAIDDDWTSTFPGGPEGSREWFSGLGTLSDDTVERWRAIRTALASAKRFREGQ